MIPVGPVVAKGQMSAVRDTVWAYLVRPDLRAEWWPELVLDARFGGTVSERWSEGEGDNAVSRDAAGAVDVVVEGHALGFRWKEAGDARATAVLITLRSMEGATAVTVSETGFDTLSEPATRAASSQEGWRVLLGDLAAAAEASGDVLPDPPAEPVVVEPTEPVVVEPLASEPAPEGTPDSEGAEGTDPSAEAPEESGAVAGSETPDASAEPVEDPEETAVADGEPAADPIEGEVEPESEAEPEPEPEPEAESVPGPEPEEAPGSESAEAEIIDGEIVEPEVFAETVTVEVDAEDALDAEEATAEAGEPEEGSADAATGSEAHEAEAHDTVEVPEASAASGDEPAESDTPAQVEADDPADADDHSDEPWRALGIDTDESDDGPDFDSLIKGR